MQDISAFIDEFGNTSINIEKDGVTTYFIVTAVLVKTTDLILVRQQAEDIRQRFFQSGEMKSSGIGNNDSRRIKVIEAINGLEFKTFSFAVDKSEIYKESGLAYKRTFFKFLNRRLYERLHRVFDNIDVVADEHGTENFMSGFEEYISKTLRPNLFARRSFTFAKSHDEPLLQVADIVSGTIARSFEPSKLSPQTEELMQLVSEHSIGITSWPIRRLPASKEAATKPSEANDETIRQHCLRSAEIFLSKADRDDENKRIQAELLEYLLFYSEYVNSRSFVSTPQIVEHLRSSLNIEMSDYRLRSVGIGPLRDADVIIASSQKGYKIPVCMEDISKFVEHDNTIVPPMIARLRRAREELKLASMGDLDILEHDHFSYLRCLSDVTL